MDATRHLSIELSEDMAEAVRARVESGEFASESEVVRAGLELLQEQDEPHDPELDGQLAAGYDSWKANPTAVYTLEEVEEHLREQPRSIGNEALPRPLWRGRGSLSALNLALYRRTG